MTTPTPDPTLTLTRLLPPDAVRVPSIADPTSMWVAPRSFQWVARVDPTTPGLDALPVVGPELEMAVAKAASTGDARTRVTPVPVLGDLETVPLVRHGDPFARWSHAQGVVLAQLLERGPSTADHQLLVVAHQLGGPSSVIEFSTPNGPAWGYLMPVTAKPEPTGQLADRFAPVPTAVAR